MLPILHFRGGIHSLQRMFRCCGSLAWPLASRISETGVGEPNRAHALRIGRAWSTLSWRLGSEHPTGPDAPRIPMDVLGLPSR